MARVGVFTIGCKVNQGESEELKMCLAEAGHAISNDPGLADLCVVNTCTVTAESDRKCRKLIRSLSKRGANAIVVAGCYAQVSAEELGRLPGVVAIIPNSEKDCWEQRIESLLHEADAGAQPLSLSRTRAFIKVQDGCERECSYCIVPTARGDEWSRPIAEVLALANKWLDQGTRELVLCGINLGRYRPQAGFDLGCLVEEVLDIGGDFRIRISSIELEDMDMSWLQAWSVSEGRVCPHLHFPLQSGDAGILADMGRGYNPGDFIEVCREAKAGWPGMTVTTEVIAGYPGESEEAFHHTLDVLTEARPSRTHVFPFSKRPGTRASHKLECVPPGAIAERCGRLRSLAEEWRVAYAKERIGESARLLIERIVEGEPRVALGTTEDYIKGSLIEPSNGARPGCIVVARITGVNDGSAVLEVDGHDGK
ncbi:MAG: hypothetical protein A2Y75_04640 [Candidatus Solincola sediminis]|uniref:Uncharacterized protein n=1 Tax=Candidatus Solincola sediminis TaxID=1797199 RepID=A0A1F2WGK8_9ACTN|nr:MAG: hypothetical protein A2Y75_04640 [Candidatus Solincola sediminis]